EGVQPAQCPPGPFDLTSTLTGPGSAETLKITSSPNVTVRFLNIVNGSLAGHDGLEYKKSGPGLANCNCVAFNDDEGIQVHAGNGIALGGSTVTPTNGSDNNFVNGNMISGNGDGLVDKIRCLRGSGNTGNNVTGTGCE